MEVLKEDGQRRRNEDGAGREQSERREGAVREALYQRIALAGEDTASRTCATTPRVSSP